MVSMTFFQSVVAESWREEYIEKFVVWVGDLGERRRQKWSATLAGLPRGYGVEVSMLPPTNTVSLVWQGSLWRRNDPRSGACEGTYGNETSGDSGRPHADFAGGELDEATPNTLC